MSNSVMKLGDEKAYASGTNDDETLLQELFVRMILAASGILYDQLVPA